MEKYLPINKVRIAHKLTISNNFINNQQLLSVINYIFATQNMHLIEGRTKKRI